MPSLQRMVEVANAFWRRDNIQNINRDWFLPNKALGTFNEALAGGNKFDLNVANHLPKGLQEMLRALYLYNLDGPRLGIQFAWMPGYDWELTVTECPGTPQSPGAFTVLIRSRYPLDRHPSEITTQDKG